MIIRKKTRDISRRHVNKKLTFKLRRLAVVFIVVIAIIFYNLIQGIIHPSLVLIGIVSGFIIGSIMGRFSNIYWHEETSKVISNWNRITVTILILYLAFAFSKNWIFGHWIHGPALSAFSISVASGVLTGRIISIRKQIRGILREKGYLKTK